MTNAAEKITYFLYARKSSESEDRQVQSIEDQINRLTELAKNLNLEIKEVLTEAKSAKKPGNRPIFAEMLERIEKGEANGILCWQINRLSRNPVESGMLSWMLQQGVLQSIQTIDRQHLPDDNVLLFSVESGVANQFIIDLRKNSMRGMQSKADKGVFPGLAPVGYLNDQIDHTIIKDPERYDLVRRMWDMMLTGNYTPPQVMEIANNEWGFRTISRKRRGGGELVKSRVYKMFTNIFYAGMFEWSGKLYQGTHEPMITMEEYDRVQAILGRNGKPRAKTHEFAFTGIMTCEMCGSMYTAEEKEKLVKRTGELKTYVYYRCTRRKKGVHCTEKGNIPLDKVEDQIETEINKYTILPEFQEWALEILNQSNDREIEDRTKVYEMRHKSLTETQKELDNLTRMRYRELIDDETFIRERDALRSRIAKLKGELRETEDRAEKWIELTEKTFQFATYAHKAFLFGTLDEKREIFAALGYNFSVKDKKLNVSANEWLTPIEKSYPALKAQYERLELTGSIDNKEREAALTSIRSVWGQQYDCIINILSDSVYMEDLRQKMVNALTNL